MAQDIIEVQVNQGIVKELIRLVMGYLDGAFTSEEVVNQLVVFLQKSGRL
jgi:hypothetical protein